MRCDDLDVIRSLGDARRPLSTYEVARRLGISRDAALEALMAAYRARYLVPVDPAHDGVLCWRLTTAGARLSDSEQAGANRR
jgi:hypothetical protein